MKIDKLTLETNARGRRSFGKKKMLVSTLIIVGYRRRELLVVKKRQIHSENDRF